MPSQRSANTPFPLPLPVWPTASHAVADAHEMPLSWPEPGMLTIVHVLPVRCSASRLLFVLPTAMQEVGDVQDTALNCQLVAPGGAGVFCSSQLAAAGWAIISSTVVATAAASTRRLIAIVKLPVRFGQACRGGRRQVRWR